MSWTPPSIKKLGNLPHIVVEEVDQIQKYIDWYNANPGIPRTVPPIYQDFVIEFSRSYLPGPRTYRYIEIVHYDDDLCGFQVAHVIDGKKMGIISSRYEDYDDARIKIGLTAPTSTLYKVEWMKQEGVTAACTVLAVQMYILYHRPELVPVELPEPRRERLPAGKKPQNGMARKVIADTRRQIIRLGEKDTDFRVVNYRKIQWTVRGHYRRLKSGKVVYVRPHAARRGNKKLKPGLTILK